MNCPDHCAFLSVVLQETLKELLNLFVKFRPHSEGSMKTLLPNPVKPDYFTFTFFTHFYNDNILTFIFPYKLSGVELKGKDIN